MYHFTALSLKYTDANEPTDGLIGIVLFDKDDKDEAVIAQSENAYFISGYTYRYSSWKKNKDNEYDWKLILRISDIDNDYSGNRTNYKKIKNWIEWIEDRNEEIEICEKITKVPNKKNSRNNYSLLTFKNAAIRTD